MQLIPRYKIGDIVIRKGIRGNDIFVRIISVHISKDFNEVCYEGVQRDDPRADDDKPVGYFAEEDARPAQLELFKI